MIVSGGGAADGWGQSLTTNHDLRRPPYLQQFMTATSRALKAPLLRKGKPQRLCNNAPTNECRGIKMTGPMSHANPMLPESGAPQTNGAPRRIHNAPRTRAAERKSSGRARPKAAWTDARSDPREPLAELPSRAHIGPCRTNSTRIGKPSQTLRNFPPELAELGQSLAEITLTSKPSPAEQCEGVVP